MSIFDSRELMIVKGVGPVPGDTASAEQPLQVVDFYDADSGYALSDWTPNIPSLKNGGLWADSSISDGRSLIAGQNTNVIETITVTLTGATGADFASQFAKLQRMIQDARNFWTTFGQIEPVYLRWWAACAPGPQFALIYNIDMDVEWQDSAMASAILTLSVEREFGWRGIRPGGNPREWSMFVANQPWDTTKASLIGASGAINTQDLIDQQITNKTEFSTATTIAVQSFIDIPATSIPGDLPALVCVTVQQTLTDNSPTVYIGRVSKPLSLPNRAGGNALPHYNDFPVASATMNIADTTLVGDGTGLSYAGSGGQRARTTFATSAAMSLRFSWNTNIHRSFAVLRGRYALFLRARQNAGASGDTAIRIDFMDASTGLPTAFFSSSNITPIVTASIALHYCGVVTIPGGQKTFVGARGNGIQSASAANYGGEFVVQVYAQRTAGAGTIDIFDMILLPIDEGAARIMPTATNAGNGHHVIFDNTGYFTHGRLEDFGEGRRAQFTTADDIMTTDFSSYGMALTPQTTNRLYFLLHRKDTNVTLPNDVAYVGINIIPRWNGIRDK